MIWESLSCGDVVYCNFLWKEVSDQTMQRPNRVLEERRDAEAVIGTETVETFFDGESRMVLHADIVAAQGKIVCELLWRFAWKAVLYLSWQGCDHG